MALECFYLCSDVVYTAERGTALRVFGRLRSGEKVAVLVSGFRDFVDVHLPGSVRHKERACTCLLEQLNQALSQHRLHGLGGDPVCQGERVNSRPTITRQTSVMGYREEGADFLRVYVKEPFMLPVVEGMLRAPLPHCDEQGRKRGWLNNPVVARAFFPSVKSLKDSEQDLSRYSFELFNGTSLDYRMKCTHYLNLKPCTWFVIPEEGVRETRGAFTRGLREFAVSGQRPFEGAEGIPPTELLWCAGFDIECLSTTGQFPDARRDPVITVSVCAHRLSEMGIRRGAAGLAVADGDVMRRFVLQLGSVAGVRGAEGTMPDATPQERFANVEAPAECRVQAFPFEEGDEAARAAAEVRLLRALIAIFKELQPDILYSWNGNGFDLPYLLTRCETLGGALLEDFKRSLSLGGRATRVFTPMQHKFVKANGFTGVGGGRALVPDTMTYSEKEVKTSALGHQVPRGAAPPAGGCAPRHPPPL